MPVERHVCVEGGDQGGFAIHATGKAPQDNGPPEYRVERAILLFTILKRRRHDFRAHFRAFK